LDKSTSAIEQRHNEMGLTQMQGTG
jgi:hypothetical protein